MGKSKLEEDHAREREREGRSIFDIDFELLRGIYIGKFTSRGVR